MNDRFGPEANPKSHEDLPPFLSAEDVSRLFRVPRRTVYSWVDQGLLPARRIGPRLLRFAPQDLRAFCESSEERQ
jgi:excisionase family DNA binding protein